MQAHLGHSKEPYFYTLHKVQWHKQVTSLFMDEPQAMGIQFQLGKDKFLGSMRIYEHLKVLCEIGTIEPFWSILHIFSNISKSFKKLHCLSIDPRVGKGLGLF